MRLPPFQFLEPANVEEAVSMIAARKETVKVMAGGTDLLNQMRLRLIEPPFVMNIGKLQDMEGIDVTENQTIIGASTKLKDIAHSPLIHQRFRAIAEAAYQVASPTVINMATVGGNLLQNTRCLYYNQSGIVLNGLERCHKRGGSACLAVKGSKRCVSVYQGDMAPALIAFDAKCVLEKKGSRRTIALTELFTGNGVNPFAIGADELLTKVLIPQPKNRFSSAYQKLRLRGSLDYPLASAATVVSVLKGGKVNISRIVLGSVGASPRVMDGTSCGADLESIAQRAYELSEAVDNLQMPGAYRRKMAGVLAKRAIQVAIDRVKEEVGDE
jgi:4-hydroxybenzoyl-CoA reductase subunit beta